MQKKMFTPADPALPINYPSFVFRSLTERGFSKDALLEETGLEESHLNDPHFRCGFQPLRRFFLNAIEQAQDPNLGVKLALKFQPTYIGLPSYAAMNAACFESGLDTLSRFFFLSFPALELKVQKAKPRLSDEEAAIRLRPKFPFDEIEYFGISSAIIAINGLLKAMLQSDEAAIRAEMTVKRPERWCDIEAKLDVAFYFEAPENLIVFPKILMDTSLPGSDPINHARLVGLCEQLAEKITYETTLVTQVIAVIENTSFLKISLSCVADELGYSERNLRRLLDQSGTSYRKLVDQVREQRARELLSSSRQPIKAIAIELGFDSSSNFARSFKQWTGLSPKAFRSRALLLGQSNVGRK